MIPLVDALSAFIGARLGISNDSAKLLLCLLLSIPFAAVMKRLPDHRPDLKNLYNILISLFYVVGIFSLWGGLRTLLTSSLGTYVLSAFIKNRYMPWIVFIFVMGHMGLTHYARMALPAGVVDATGAQMVLCMKLTAFAWNIHDGRQPEARLNAFQKDRALRYMPSILDFLGYAFFFPSLLIGPSFDMAEYLRYIHLTMFDIEVPDKTSKTGRVRKRRIPSSSIPTLKKVLEGLFWCGLYATLSKVYNTDFALSNEFLSYSFFQRLFYLAGLGFTIRTKYFGVWTLSESSVIWCGLGYNGIGLDGKRRWDRLTNIEPWAMETAQNSKKILESWNKNTNKWLRNYVYLRVASKKKGIPGTKSTLFTFILTAYWHGFYPGYYLTFVTAACVQICDYRRYLRPFFLKPDGTFTNKKVYYDIIGWLVTKVVYDYLNVGILVLHFNGSMIFWSRLWFFGHIGIGLSLAFFTEPGKHWINRKLGERGQSKDREHKL